MNGMGHSIEWMCCRCPPGTPTLPSHAAMLDHARSCHGVTDEDLKRAKGISVLRACGGNSGSTHVDEFSVDDAPLVQRISSSFRLKKCSGCAQPTADRLCDGVMDRVRHPRASGSKTCDRPLCKACSTKKGGKDYCADHVGQASVDQLELKPNPQPVWDLD